MSNKQDILNAIRQSAKENEDIPLGVSRFEKETGIKKYHWQKYWAKFGDAQKEAGFVPNQFKSAYSDKFIIKKMIILIRKLKKFPTPAELRIEKNNDPEFPNTKTLFETKEQKYNLATTIIEWCKEESGYDDIIKFCTPILGESKKIKNLDGGNVCQTLGEVYLFKSGRYYKIGKTNDTVRRGSEIRIQLPEKMDLIHSIKTDDPSGIEVYWHRRFESKRMNGEWFDLNAAEVKAFKCWRRII